LEGIGSARAIDRLCQQHAAYRWLCANFGVSGRRFRFKPAGDFGRNRQAVSVQSGTLSRRRLGAGLSEPPLRR
jgi:hypothetical protein